ncbi:MAG: prephenate dehydratase, partial [Spirochaetia bacterium]|nr:prephenate dehydratase [Spirochaetia bacterium]
RFPDAALTNIFREIISACRSLEAPIRIAYFGALGSFTHEAALRIFGASSNLSSCREVGDVFEEVESEKADYGVVPVENSIEGVVNRTFDMFLTSRLGIIAESYLQVHHCLLSSEKKVTGIKKILSHPQPFAQCRAWLKRHVPDAKLVETSSTSEAAKMARGKKGVAAIASWKASETYGVPVLFENIEDNPDNVTRFAVIARECKTQRTGDDRSSVFFSIPDRPGTLETILQFIAKNGINMSKIVSRPSQRKAFEYSFFIELEGHRDDPKLAGCLAEIEKKSTFFRLVGSYPRSKMI